MGSADDIPAYVPEGHGDPLRCSGVVRLPDLPELEVETLLWPKATAHECPYATRPHPFLPGWVFAWLVTNRSTGETASSFGAAPAAPRLYRPRPGK